MKSSARLLRILQFLLMKKQTTYKEIEECLSLSQRVIRYEIENINNLLLILDYPQIEKGSKGSLVLESGDEENIIRKIAQIAKPSAEERKEYMMYKLLMENKLTLQHEMEEFDVSRNTLRRDLKEIRNELMTEKIYMKDYMLDEPEEGVIRQYLLKCYFREYPILFEKDADDEHCSLIQQYIRQDFREIDVAQVLTFTECINRVKELSNNDYLISCILIAYQRIKRQHPIKCENRDFLMNTSEFELIQEHIDILEDCFSLKFSDDECAALCDCVLGFTENTYDAYMDSDLYDNLTQPLNFVRKFIKNVGKEINCDLTQDSKLLEGLDYHFRSLIYRVKNGIASEDVLYFEAAEQYPELYQVIESQLKEFEELLDTKVSKEEISLFVIHFLGAIRRNENQHIQEKKIVLLCGNGYGTSTVLQHLMESNYYVEVVDTISYYQVKSYNFQKIDLLVTTIEISFELSEQLSVPVIMVSPFLTLQDDEELKIFGIQRKTKMSDPPMQMMMALINKYAVIKDQKRLEEGLQELFDEQNEDQKHSLFQCLEDKNIIVMDTVSSWEKSLQICGNYLIQEDAIREEYMKEIFNTIENFGAYFVLRNQVAMPHGQPGCNVQKDAMQILYIRNGVQYPGEKKIKLIFLIAANEKTTLLNTVMKVDEVVQNSNLYEEIESHIEKGTLLSYFQSI